MQNYWFMSGAVIDNNIYFITEEYGDLIKIDVETYKAQYIYMEDELTMPLSAVIFADNEYIYAILAKGKYLLKYSVFSGSKERFYLGLESKWLNITASVLKIEKELIIVPILSNSIVHVNTITGEVTETVINADEYQKGERFFAKCSERYGKNIWLFSNGTKEIIQYNIYTKERLCHAYPKGITKVMDVENWHDSFYILDALGNVFVWKPDSFMEVILRSKLQENEVSTFHVADDRIWLMPAFGKEIICYDTKSKKCKIQEYYPKGFLYTASIEMEKYPQKIRTDQRCYFSMHSGNYIFYVDQKTGEGKWADVIWPDDRKIAKYLMRKNIVPEKRMLIDLYCTCIENRRKLVGIKKTNGENIWEDCICNMKTDKKVFAK